LEIDNPLMLPEISRRCSSCGASIRERAMFCPQCGQALANAAQVSEPPLAADAKTPPATEKPPAGDASNRTADTSSYSPEPQSAGPIETRRPVSAPAHDKNRAGRQAAATSHPGKVERTRERLQRASSVARGALEENVKRVDRIRHVSTVVLEEASYDPSLRFVLVALALFLVFVFLLVLSKVMG
jgi:hypothetical protein